MNKLFLSGVLAVTALVLLAIMLAPVTGVAASSLPFAPNPQQTPTPLPYAITSHYNQNNCADIGITGTVIGPDGLPRGGVTIQYGEVGVSNSRFIATTDYDGRYSGELLSAQDRAAVQVSHTWYVYVLENRQPVSQVFEWSSDPIFAKNPKRCGNTSDGKQPGCIMDPCRSRNAIQVKTVNWQAWY